ncbi:MAG: hypothetical protein AB8B51_09670 [Sedimentitalea sp.]
MRIMTGVLSLLPGVVCAQDWQALSGDEVRAALEGRTLTYTSGAVQDFRASGKTLYNAGQDSWGNWRVQGAQYCSQWSPSDLWACYDMAKRKETLRFIGEAGDVTDGVYSD